MDPLRHLGTRVRPESAIPSPCQRTGPTLPRHKVKNWDQFAAGTPVGPQRARGSGFGEISRIAGAQDGVVARRELLTAGISRARIDHHLARENLVSVYRAVYAIGHSRLAPIGRFRAAILLVGGEVCLSHLSAAQVHGLVDVGPFTGPGIIHVTRRGGGRHGIRPSLARDQPPACVHRVKALRVDDVCRRRGLAVTTVERTLIDLAPRLPFTRLESTVLKAQRLNLLDVVALAQRLSDGMRGHKGIDSLRRLIERATPDKAKTLSDPEAWLLDLFRKHGLPRPLVNESVEGFKVDFYWPEAGLIVEFDGHSFHSSREALRRDKRRDRILQLAGYRVLRYTYEDLTTTPERLVAEIAAALNQRSDR